jgi:hypothetical protein
MDDRANEAIVVAMMALGLPSPISSAMVVARMWKNGWKMRKLTSAE